MAISLFRSYVPTVTNHLWRNIVKRQNNMVSGGVFIDEKCSEPLLRGLVLGIYTDETNPEDQGVLTATAERYNKKVCGRLLQLIRSCPVPRRGEIRILYNVENDFMAIAVVGLGKECLGYNAAEEIDEGKEAVRAGAALGCRELMKLRPNKIYVETLGNAESAAEGAALAVWIYQELRNPKKQVKIPALEMHADGDCDWEGWQIGLQKAAAQNLARQLMETPANLMTPTMFAQNAVEVLCKSGVNVEVKVRAWAESQKMHAFLAVAKGSCEPPIFLELSYYGAGRTERPIVMVGKGVTFDSGGTCLKKRQDMRHMRGDMAGAAAVVASCRAIAALQLPINIRGLIPLCEHMPGCNAMKPGDIVTAMNGKAIEIQDTDKEGRLLLADALLYAQNFWPRFIIDIGTLTEVMAQGMGSCATGVFSNSEDLWQQMRMAGVHTGDRVWRFPLWKYYNKQMTSQRNVEVQNTGLGKGGDPCKAAAFLWEFVPCGEWIHLDAYATMLTDGCEFPYLRKGMSGRPVRTIVEFLAQLVCRGGEFPC